MRVLTIIDELAYPDFCAKQGITPLNLSDLEEWRQIPFDQVLIKEDVPFLDALNHYMGSFPKWLASKERARLMKGKRATKTTSRDRTRSRRWQAGTSRLKPKHNWSKRKREHFCVR